jgi:hypothetical protein
MQISANHSGMNLNGPMKSFPAHINGTFGEKSEMKKAKKIKASGIVAISPITFQSD